MKKGLILILSIVMVVCISISATLAYLFVETTPVENTFEYGDVNIDLKEDKLKDDGTLDPNTPVTTNTYKYVPGDTLNKRPYVTVKATSQKCYLFIKVNEENNTYTDLTGKIVDWNIDTSIWTKLDDVDGVWYKVIDTLTTKDTSYDILSGDKVTVNPGVTKTIINADDFKAPELTFTAYAVQKDNVTSVADAWKLVETKGIPSNS
jgi:hypothetical protein